MGEIRNPSPCLFLAALLSRHDTAIQWGIEQLVSLLGGGTKQGGTLEQPIAVSDKLSFRDTCYYESEMGSDLAMRLAVFSTPFNPAAIADIKNQTNRLERELAVQEKYPEIRPLNIDPGYLTPMKFILATTKDAGHRIYLGLGIYAEVTLSYSHGDWQEHSWTYSNYRREEFKSFLHKCRKLISHSNLCPSVSTGR